MNWIGLNITSILKVCPCNFLKKGPKVFCFTQKRVCLQKVIKISRKHFESIKVTNNISKTNRRCKTTRINYMNNTYIYEYHF